MTRLHFKQSLAEDYSSQSQKARVLTEHWVSAYAYCPNCANEHINKYPNNKPVADFLCQNCLEDFELKSKKNTIGMKIVDGAYHTMVERLQSTSNPNFFLLNYDHQHMRVRDFLVIPKHFFVPEIIERRKPLAPTAKRAGWVGCNILLHGVPKAGKIYYVKNGKVEPKEKVLGNWSKTLFLREQKNISARGWTLDVMKSVERLNKREFVLDEVYGFEKELEKSHPDNKHIKDKIRQQLQVLRDRGYLEFVSPGRYKLADDV